jgi:hypothetical protein
VCQALIEDNRAQLGDKPVAISLAGATDVYVERPEAVVAVALGNLIGNACKYTKKAKCACRREDARLIEDSGPGLSEEDAAKLFERGYRGFRRRRHQRRRHWPVDRAPACASLYGWTGSIAPGRRARRVAAALAFPVEQG